MQARRVLRRLFGVFPGGGNPARVRIAQRRERKEPHERALQACAAFPGASHGALIATSRSVGEDGAATGNTTMYRVSPGTGLARETARLARPVAGLLPLGSDIVILLRGDEIRVYVEPLDRHLSLAPLEFRHTDWSFSPTRETLLVTSYPQSHAAGEPSAPLQAIVLQ